MTDEEFMLKLLKFIDKNNIAPRQSCHCMATLILRMAAEQQAQIEEEKENEL